MNWLLPIVLFLAAAGCGKKEAEAEKPSRAEIRKQKEDAFKSKYPNVAIIKTPSILFSTTLKAQKDFPVNSLAIIADARLQDVFVRDGKTIGLFSSAFTEFEIDMTDKSGGSIIEARRYTEWAMVIRLSSIKRISRIEAKSISTEEAEMEIDYNFFRVEGTCVEIEPVEEGL
jgi:hypothetical protein